MNASESTALLSASIAGFIAVAVFIAGEIAKEVRGRREKKRQLIARVLDAIDATLRSHTRVLSSLSQNHGEMGLALLQTRLAMDLPARDVAISNWLWAQTQRVLLAKDREAAIGMALARWYQGSMKTAWFTSELVKEPVITKFAIPRGLRWRRNLSTFGQILLMGIGVGAALIGSKAALTSAS
jgi:hypothetical protein